MTTLSKTEYISQVNTLLADNSTRQISPADLRKSFIDLADSLGNLLNGIEVDSSNFSTPSTRSTKAGKEALNSLSLAGRTSVDNSAFGYRSLYQNYNGIENTALGSYALSCNLYGRNNTAVGVNSIGSNVGGSGNTAIGSYSLNTNKFGDFNIAIGFGAGFGATENENHKFYLGVHEQASGGCDVTPHGNTVPLLYGDLKTRQLGISVESFVSDEKLRVPGDVRISGDVLMNGNIRPLENATYTVGTPSEKWNGYFHDLHVCNLYYDCEPDIIEGFMTEQILAPSGYCFPTSGILRVKLVTPSGELDGGTCQDGYDKVIINRDATLAISGCQYVIAHKINHEYRPIWVGCSGYCDDL
jgi:hypothetical protein